MVARKECVPTLGLQESSLWGQKCVFLKLWPHQYGVIFGGGGIPLWIPSGGLLGEFCVMLPLGESGNRHRRALYFFLKPVCGSIIISKSIAL